MFIPPASAGPPLGYGTIAMSLVFENVVILQSDIYAKTTLFFFPFFVHYFSLGLFPCMYLTRMILRVIEVWGYTYMRIAFLCVVPVCVCWFFLFLCTRRKVSESFLNKAG